MGRAVVLIPCYNVANYCEKVIAHVLALPVGAILAIDDGSVDGTETILAAQTAQHPEKIHLVRLTPNQGKGFALQKGFAYTFAHIPFDVLVTLDGDGQHNPSFILPLCQEIEKGADLAIGCRRFAEMPRKNQIANRIISFLLHLLYQKAPLDTQSGFRAFSKDFAKEVAEKIPGGRYEMEFQTLLLALKQGRKIASLPISTLYLDRNVSSHFRIWSDSLRILKSFLFHLLRLS